MMDDFTNFKDIKLETPEATSISNTYFTRISYQSHPIYIQTAKCNIVNGLLCSENINFCNLMYKNDDSFLGWFEILESTLIDLVYDKRHLWFQSNLSKHTLKSNFISPLKSHNRGKNSLIKVIIPDNINCYDEKGEPISLSNLNNNEQTFIPLIELSGIKFLTYKSFSCEFTLKQIMKISSVTKIKEEKINIVTPIVDYNSNEIININIQENENDEETFTLSSREVILDKKWSQLRDKVQKAKSLLVELYKKEKNLRELNNKNIEKDIFDIFLEEQICLG